MKSTTGASIQLIADNTYGKSNFANNSTQTF